MVRVHVKLKATISDIKETTKNLIASKTKTIGLDIGTINVAEVVQSSTLLPFVESDLFKSLFTGIILLNSLVLALPDYSKIDEQGYLSPANSWRNNVYLQSEVVFLSVFSLEAVLKLLAMGIFGPRSYSNDSWNILDFLVLGIGWIAYGITASKNYVAILRLMRVLRPLKAITASSSLRKVVVVIFHGFPKLSNVLAITSFIFIFFAIFGLQLFSGPLMHTRCRLTPFPVKMNWTQENSFYEFRCLAADNIDDASFFPQMTKSSSPWSAPVDDCYWPVDDSNERLCSFSNFGMNPCYHDLDTLPRDSWSWCGSNFDGFGNPRFSDEKLMQAPLYAEFASWGHINFDNIFYAVLTVMEIVVVFNWSEIMYLMQDSFGGIVALYFIFVVIIGSFITLNLILTSLNSTVEDFKEDDSGTTGDVDKQDDFKMEDNEKCDSSIPDGPPSPMVGFCSSFLGDFHLWKLEALVDFMEHDITKNFSAAVVLVNAVFLSVKHYPSDAQFDNVIQAGYFFMTLFFMVELLGNMCAYGLKEFFSSYLNILDFIVIVVGFIDECMAPPQFIAAAAGRSNSSAYNVFAVLRLIRLGMIMMAALNLSSVREFLDRLRTTIVTTISFTLVFLLFLYVVALIGMAFFANKLRFDGDGYYIPVTDREAWLDAEERPRFNFDSFMLALASVFQIVTGEGWYVIMDDVWRSQGAPAIAFPIVVLVVGDFVLLNQLLTFIIDDICSSEKQEGEGGLVDVSDFGVTSGGVAAPSAAVVRAEGVRATLAASTKVQGEGGRGAVGGVSSSGKGGGDVGGGRLTVRRSSVSSDFSAGYFEIDYDNKAVVTLNKDKIVARQRALFADFQEFEFNMQGEATNKSFNDDFGSSGYWESLPQRDSVPSADSNYAGSKILSDLLSSVHNSMGFKYFFAAITVVSTVVLAVDSPLLDPRSDLFLRLFVLNVIVSAAFLLENLIEILAFGPRDYFSSPWNVADLVATIVSVAGLASSNVGLRSLRVLKAFRCLRLLQTIQYFDGLKHTLQAVFDVIPNSTFIFTFFIGTIYLFAVFCVSILAGQLRSCQGVVYDAVISVDPSFMKLLETPVIWSKMSDTQRNLFSPINSVFESYNLTQSAQSVCGASWPYQPCCFDSATASVHKGPLFPTALSRPLCECWGGEWLPVTDWGFDNVAQGVLTLFQLATLEGWADYMYKVIDCTGVDMQPIRDYNVSWVFFFIFFLMVSNYLFLNLFIGEVVKSFNDNAIAKEDQPGDEIMKSKIDPNELWVDLFMSSSQQDDSKIAASQRLMSLWQLPNGLRAYMEKRPAILRFAALLEQDPLFDGFVMLVVCANTIILGMQYFGQDDAYRRGLDQANIAFGVVFNVELLVKLMAQEVQYFTSFSNCLDALIVLGTDIEIIISLYSLNGASMIVSLGRLLRVVKVSRVLKARQIQQLIRALYAVSRQLMNIGIFLIFLVTIYAIIGFQSFSKTAFNNLYDEHANFRTFGSSLLTMLRFSTGAGWDEYMFSVFTVQDCVTDPQYQESVCGFNDFPGCTPLNGCGSLGIFPFMISFIIVVTFVCLNLFVAVIIGALDAFEAESVFAGIDPYLRDAFTDAWIKYDPEQTGFISVSHLELLVIDEDNPFPLLVRKGAQTATDLLAEMRDGKKTRRHSLKLKKTMLRDIVGIVPFSVKIGPSGRSGCLFVDVFRILVLSTNSNLLDLTRQFPMDIEKRRLQDRTWLSLREYYAAMTISRRCRRFWMVRIIQKKRKEAMLRAVWKVWGAQKPTWVKRTVVQRVLDLDSYSPMKMFSSPMRIF